MNANQLPLVPAVARFAVAVAVVAALSAVWVGAESASHTAVDNSATALSSPTTRFVKLQDVEIVARRTQKSPNA